MPRRTLRLRVGDLTLAVEAERRTRALDPPPELEPFLVRSGGDIRLTLMSTPPPSPRGEALFDSGGVWRVFRHGSGLLYQFRIPQLESPVYKAVTIDGRLRKGRLFFPGVEADGIEAGLPVISDGAAEIRLRGRHDCFQAAGTPDHASGAQSRQGWRSYGRRTRRPS